MVTPSTKQLPFADVIPSELDADTQAVIEKLMTGKPLDPETYMRIRDRGERVTEKARRKFGQSNIAVELVREARDAE